MPSDINWQKVIDISFDQGVAAIAVDGIGKATKTKTKTAEALDALDSPELEDLKYEWFGEVFSCEEDYKNYQSAIAQFVKLCREQQVDVLLLKGYGLSLNYPIPSHRVCGDVDVFVNDNDDDNDNPLPAWKRINNLMRERGIEVNEGNPHHSVFSFGVYLRESYHAFGR